MPDEDVQERGREGVGMIRAWLEATTWMQFPFNAYEDGTRCSVLLLEDKTKKFDLRGFHLGVKHERRNMNVECKRYTSPGAQMREFRRFLAIAYSSHARQQQIHGSAAMSEDFLWVTSNPFKADGWRDLCTEEAIEDAITHADHADIIADHKIDKKLIRTVADGLWLLVFDEKQLDVTLTPAELKNVMTVLNREGVGLWQA